MGNKMNCEKCPYKKLADDNFIKVMLECDKTIKDTKEMLGEDAYEKDDGRT